MKKSVMVMAFVSLSLWGYSRTMQPQPDKQVNDPQRKANAGKADVIILEKKNIFDSTTFDNKAAEGPAKKTVKANSGRKHCGSTKKHNRVSASGKKGLNSSTR